jgi:glycosyltransferase involved in cell wall biosynthesis
MTSKIIFCVPKSHNNLLPWLNLIRESGSEIEFLVIRKNIVHSQEVTNLPGSYWLVNLIRKLNSSKDPAKIIDAFFLPNPFFLWKKINQVNVSSVFVRFNFGFFFLTTLIAAFFARKKLVLYSQGSFLSDKSVFKKIIASSVRIFFSGTWITPVYYKAYGSRNSDHLIRYSTFVPFFYGNSGKIREVAQGPVLKVILLGKYIKRKRHLEMLQAIHAHNSENIHFDFFGELNFNEQSYYNACVDFVEKNKLSNVAMHKNVPYEDVQRKMMDFHVLVLMSDDETCSFSQMEAMYNGLAVIINADNGSANYVADGINGFIVKPKEYDLVLYRLKQFDRDKDLLKRFRMNSVEIMNGYERIARSMINKRLI